MTDDLSTRLPDSDMLCEIGRLGILNCFKFFFCMQLE